MKRVEPQSIRQIIDRVLSTSGSRQEMLEHRASYLWSEIVGPGINRNTSRRYVTNGVLHVYITSAAMKSEIEHSKSRIIDAINSALDAPVLTSIAVH